VFPLVDLHLYERSMFTHRFYVYDCDGAAADLTGHSARLEVRRAPDLTVLATATSADALVVNAGGYVDLTWTGAETEAMGGFGPALMYDLFIFPDGAPDNAVVIARGHVVTRKNITIPVAPSGG
jgi:hypothetical protein